VAAVDSAGHDGAVSQQDSVTAPEPAPLQLVFGFSDTLITASDTLEIPLTFDGDFTGRGITSFQLKIEFDSTLLRGVDIDDSDFGLTLTSEVSATSGALMIAATYIDTLYGEDRQLTLKLRAYEYAAYDTTFLTFSEALLDESASGLDTFIARIRVLPRIGDANGNGEISSSDASLILQSVVEMISFTSQQEYVADVSYNGSISAYDASLILHKAVGRISKFPKEDSLGLKEAKFDFDPEAISLVQRKENTILWYDIYTDIPVELSAFEFVLEYNTENTVYQRLVPADNLSSFIQQTHVNDGKIHFAAAGDQTIPVTGVITSIGFSVDENTQTDAAVFLQRLTLNEAQILESSISSENNAIPLSYELQQNYPNPFNPNTTIRFQMPERNNVTLKIYNIVGQEVKTLIQQSLEPGQHTFNWDGRDNRGLPVSSGVYIYRIRAGSFIATKKMILLK